MLKITWITFTLIFATGVSAQVLEDCVNQASLYGVDYSAPRIDEACKTTVINNASAYSIDYSSDNYIQAFAAGNIIHVLYHQTDDAGNPVLALSGLTSGKFTGLNNIKAIDIDETNKMIYALNENDNGEPSVVSVQADRDGALAARAKLYTNEIIGAINIKTDREHGELYVLGSDWIKVFNIDAHHRSSLPEQSIKVKRELWGNNTGLFNVKDLAIGSEFIYVLDENKILKFDRADFTQDSLPLTSISVPNQLLHLAPDSLM